MAGTPIVSVTQLVLNFAQACRSLIPAMDFAHVPWGDLDAYDNWDRVAEPLFETLVVEPCLYQAAPNERLAGTRFSRYGFGKDVAPAYLLVDGRFRFVKFSTNVSPFDVVSFQDVLTFQDGDAPLNTAVFSFVIEDGGVRQEIQTVDLAA
jgi:hypothetical protein